MGAGIGESAFIELPPSVVAIRSRGGGEATRALSSDLALVLLGGENGDDSSILDRDPLPGRKSHMAFGSECCSELNGRRAEGCDDGLVGEIGHPFAETIDSVLGDVEVRHGAWPPSVRSWAESYRLPSAPTFSPLLLLPPSFLFLYIEGSR
ncbi:MAG: hypothetical protein CL555_06010 [Algoriphagus sp.]|nr:hypothetical protein [Algoriphagus sp.]